MICFYHGTDLDGKCAGAIVKKVHPECKMIGVDYNDTLDLSIIGIGETVFVVDFCFPTGDMLVLMHKADLIWIDHHKSAIENMSIAGIPAIKGLREIGKAGCELTWEYLNHEATIMPPAVYFLGRHDVWDHGDPEVLPFQYGMRSNGPMLPDSELWEYYLEPRNKQLIEETVAAGRAILSYQEELDKTYAEGMAYTLILPNGLKAVVMNKACCNSQAFDSVYDHNKHDLMIAWGCRRTEDGDIEYKYSLYSGQDYVDCSEIAKAYGGGGHKGAAGFFSDAMEF